MGDFNHGHIQWNSLESTGSEDQPFLFLIQDSFLTQHVDNQGRNVLDIVLSSQKELVDNVKILVPFQKQGKRCRQKHLSKEAIRKIVLKQTMWRVYRRTRKEEDNANYKEALNAATTEIR